MVQDLKEISQVALEDHLNLETAEFLDIEECLEIKEHLKRLVFPINHLQKM